MIQHAAKKYTHFSFVCFNLNNERNVFCNQVLIRDKKKNITLPNEYGPPYMQNSYLPIN